MKCNVCGMKNAEEAKYCYNCGSTLEQDDMIIKVEKQDSKEKFASASMTLGIVSVVFATVLCCFGYYSYFIALVTGGLAIIFAIISWKDGKKGQVVTGLVCGIIGLLFAIFYITSLEIYSKEIMEFLEDYFNQYMPDNIEEFY